MFLFLIFGLGADKERCQFHKLSKIYKILFFKKSYTLETSTQGYKHNMYQSYTVPSHLAAIPTCITIAQSHKNLTVLNDIIPPD